MLVDKTVFGSVCYNHANFNRFEETSSYWSVKRISGFLFFSLVNQRHTSGITVYNRTVTDIGNTVRAVHSCNSWYESKISISYKICFAFFQITALQQVVRTYASTKVARRSVCAEKDLNCRTMDLRA